MAKHNDLGNWGESLATSFLENEGYRILERNWRFGRAEVDIIATQGDLIVFVEVKARATNRFDAPESAVTIQKQERIIEAADAYISNAGIDGEVRFDVISILGDPENAELEHHIDAFQPSW